MEQYLFDRSVGSLSEICVLFKLSLCRLRTGSCLRMALVVISSDYFMDFFIIWLRINYHYVLLFQLFLMLNLLPRFQIHLKLFHCCHDLYKCLKHPQHLELERFLSGPLLNSSPQTPHCFRTPLLWAFASNDLHFSRETWDWFSRRVHFHQSLSFHMT